MDKIEYLSRAAVLGRQIRKLERNIEIRREQAQSPSSSAMGGVRVSKTRSTEAPFVRVLMVIASMEEKLGKLQEKYEALKAEIMTAIDSVDNLDYCALLELRYMQDLSWCEVANRMHIAERTAYRWHREALKKLSVPCS